MGFIFWGSKFSDTPTAAYYHPVLKPCPWLSACWHWCITLAEEQIQRALVNPWFSPQGLCWLDRCTTKRTKFLEQGSKVSLGRQSPHLSKTSQNHQKKISESRAARAMVYCFWVILCRNPTIRPWACARYFPIRNSRLPVCRDTKRSVWISWRFGMVWGSTGKNETQPTNLNAHTYVNAKTSLDVAASTSGCSLFCIFGSVWFCAEDATWKV